jgi:hypothetical protein
MMQIPDRSLVLSKAESATRQIEAAIEALLHGRFDVAITLAGAAEDWGDREGSLFEYQKRKAEELGISGKEKSRAIRACLSARFGRESKRF